MYVRVCACANVCVFEKEIELGSLCGPCKYVCNKAFMCMRVCVFVCVCVCVCVCVGVCVCVCVCE
jgi:hypothetical protein